MAKTSRNISRSAHKSNARSQKRAENVTCEPQARVARYVKDVKPRTSGQAQFMGALSTHAVTLGLGPAGSGKTYLAVCEAIRALQNNEVDRIILCRPAVEAGERLGFLPGSARDKIDPYMLPIYDILYDRLSAKTVMSMEDAKVIEVAPLAFMRGRSINRAVLILDEAQNATLTQLKMFVTRMGEGSRTIMVGDPSQSDLEDNQSGLEEFAKTVAEVKGVSVVTMGREDVVRHPVVGGIVAAFEKKARPYCILGGAAA